MSSPQVANNEADEETRLKEKEAKKAEKLAKKAAEKGDDDDGDEEEDEEEEESEEEEDYDAGPAVQASDDAIDPELEDCRTVAISSSYPSPSNIGLYSFCFFWCPARRSFWAKLDRTSN